MYEGFGFYYLPCSSFPKLKLGFTFGGRSFEIPPNVFMLGPIEDNSPYCLGSIVAEEDSSDCEIHEFIVSRTLLQHSMY